jgi:hypothetical protein
MLHFAHDPQLVWGISLIHAAYQFSLLVSDPPDKLE